jgi:hypothetical protein
MTQRDLDIDAIVIESPCSVPWSSMTGDDVRRYCGQCRLHVYDLSQMTRPEIRGLLAETNGNFCKRIWRRADGTVVTRDCGRVVRAMRRRLRAIGVTAAGLLAVVGLAGCGSKSPPSGANGRDTTTTKPAPPDEKKPPAPDATVTTGR